MELKQGYIYCVKDSFIETFSKYNLMKNTNSPASRPHYCAMQDNINEKIYWMIPISSRVEKYKKIREDKIEKYGRCDSIVIGKVRGKERAFLIQNAFPITENHVDHQYTINNKGVYVKNRQIDRSLNQAIHLSYRSNKDLFFADVKTIYKVLSADLEKDEKSKPKINFHHHVNKGITKERER